MFSPDHEVVSINEVCRLSNESVGLIADLYTGSPSQDVVVELRRIGRVLSRTRRRLINEGHHSAASDVRDVQALIRELAGDPVDLEDLMSTRTESICHDGSHLWIHRGDGPGNGLNWCSVCRCLSELGELAHTESRCSS